MSEDGYTLVEMLVALAIIGLAFGGLSEAARALGRLQMSAAAATADAKAGAGAQRALGDLLKDAGPFVSTDAEGFEGRSNAFSFACGERATCSVQIKTDGRAAALVVSRPGTPRISVAVPADAQFRYVDAGGEASSWPGSGDLPTDLKSISLVEARNRGFPFAAVTLAIDEPPACVFDVVAQACRAAP